MLQFRSMKQVVRAALWSGLIGSTVGAQAQKVDERPWRLRLSYGVAVNEKAEVSILSGSADRFRVSQPGLWRFNISSEHGLSERSALAFGFGSTAVPFNAMVYPTGCSDNTGILDPGGGTELFGATMWLRLDFTAMFVYRLYDKGRHSVACSAGLGVSVPTNPDVRYDSFLVKDFDGDDVRFAIQGRFTDVPAFLLCGELSYRYALGRASSLDLRAFANSSGRTVYSGQYVAMPGTTCETTGTWEQGLSYVSLNLGYSYRFHRKK